MRFASCVNCTAVREAALQAGPFHGARYEAQSNPFACDEFCCTSWGVLAERCPDWTFFAALSSSSIVKFAVSKDQLKFDQGPCILSCRDPFKIGLRLCGFSKAIRECVTLSLLLRVFLLSVRTIQN